MIVNNTIINNGVDTSDATATEENIDYGYTAYVNGEKIEGRSTKNADTTYDSVTEDVLLEGYTAHDRFGSEIVGSYTPPSLLNARVNIGSATTLTVDKIEKDVFDERNMTILLRCMDSMHNDMFIFIDVTI